MHTCTHAHVHMCMHMQHTHTCNTCMHMLHTCYTHMLHTYIDTLVIVCLVCCFVLVNIECVIVDCCLPLWCLPLWCLLCAVCLLLAAWQYWMCHWCLLLVMMLLYEPMKNNVIFLNMFKDVALCLSILNVSFYKANTLHGSGPKLEREEKELQKQKKICMHWASKKRNKTCKVHSRMAP